MTIKYIYMQFGSHVGKQLHEGLSAVDMTFSPDGSITNVQNAVHPISAVISTVEGNERASIIICSDLWNQFVPTYLPTREEILAWMVDNNVRISLAHVLEEIENGTPTADIMPNEESQAVFNVIREEGHFVWGSPTGNDYGIANDYNGDFDGLDLPSTKGKPFAIDLKSWRVKPYPSLESLMTGYWWDWTDHDLEIVVSWSSPFVSWELIRARIIQLNPEVR
ncbi:MAG: hypothetical protein SFZ02_12310 [bacterium]|nr:hypothetical protein [bacterium]